MRHIARKEMCNLETSCDESAASVAEEAVAKRPVLFLDVNIGRGQTERLAIYEGESAEMLAKSFAQKYGLEAKKRIKLGKIIAEQIESLNSKL